MSIINVPTEAANGYTHALCAGSLKFFFFLNPVIIMLRCLLYAVAAADLRFSGSARGHHSGESGGYPGGFQEGLV